MVLIFSFALLFLFGCSDYERDNVYDQNGNNYSSQIGVMKSSSSSKQFVPMSSNVVNEKVTASIDVSLYGSKDEKLIINAAAATTAEEMKFSRIDIVLSDGTKIITNAAAGEWTYQLKDHEFDLVGKNYCDGQSYQVQLLVYLIGKTELAASEVVSFKRNTAKCDPQSSSSMSSSSAVVLNFKQIKFDGKDTLELNTTTGNRGVIFNPASGTTTTSSANIYYDVGGTAGTLKAGSSVKIINSFAYDVATYSYGEVACYENLPPYGIKPPEKTSQLRFHPSDEGESEFEYKAGIYYMIRINSTGSDWTVGKDYLMGISNDPPKQGTGTNKTIKIIAWEVVQ